MKITIELTSGLTVKVNSSPFLNTLRGKSFYLKKINVCHRMKKRMSQILLLFPKKTKKL